MVEFKEKKIYTKQEAYLQLIQHNIEKKKY